MIFALLLPMLIVGVGAAVDLSTLNLRKMQLQQAADAASVGSVAANSPAFIAASTMPGNGAMPMGVSEAQAIFAANKPAANDTTLTSVTPDVEKSGSTVTSVVNASANFAPSFGGVLGWKIIPINVTSKSTASLPTYINYYVVVDISQSMGIASTQTDMAALYNRTALYRNGSNGETGCVFGCHVQAPSSYGGLQPVTNEALAHNISPKITLRIDSAVSAIQNIIGLAQSNSGALKNIKIGLYTISDDPVTGVNMNTVAAPSSDYSTLTNEAGTIDLGNNNFYGFGDSNFTSELTNFNLQLPANGSGVSAASPLNYVFIVTDGLADSCYNSHCDSAFNAALCTPLKLKATVGVIYTTYVPITDQANANTYNPSITALEGNYQRLVQPYISTIPTNLQNCASSSNLYFQVSDGPDIVAAMAKLFASTQKAARVAS